MRRQAAQRIPQPSLLYDPTHFHSTLRLVAIECLERQSFSEIVLLVTFQFHFLIVH